jgi:hypothetical protein
MKNSVVTMAMALVLLVAVALETRTEELLTLVIAMDCLHSRFYRDDSAFYWDVGTPER